MVQHILIVEDEPDLVRMLEYNLRREGYQTRSAHSGQAALELVASGPVPDLILLDLMLPDMPGTEVCRQLRMGERTRSVLIVMLTAKSQETDRVVGFELGADDYVVKPFSIRELLLRIRAILRRTRTAAPPPASEMVFDRLRVDSVGHRAWLDDEELRLTALEFKLLSTFVARRGRAQTRDALLADVWGIDAAVTTRTVDTHVKRLREKLGPAGRYIETIRGVGYRFRSRPEGAES